MGTEVYDGILVALPRDPDAFGPPNTPEESWHGFWVNGDDEIMCATEESANVLADFFEDCGVGLMHTRYCDDAEYDDKNYGWWSVYVDGQ